MLLLLFYRIDAERIEDTVMTNDPSEASTPAIDGTIVGNRTWLNVANVTVDMGGNKYDRPPSARWNVFANGLYDVNPAAKTPYSYFMLFLPFECIANSVNYTNDNYARANSNRQGIYNMGTALKMIGLRFAMLQDPIPGGVAAYWNVEDNDSDVRRSVKIPRRFGERFQISRNDFTTFWQHFALCPPITAQQQKVIPVIVRLLL